MDDIEHTLNGGHMYAEKPTCLLEENDCQCGHVFYNEITRLLKFYCTYCRETYDNIEYFCQHLSEHINETESLLYNKEEDISQEAEEIEYIAEDEEDCLEEEDSNDIENKSLILNTEAEEEEELAPCSYADTEDDNDGGEEDESTRDAFEYENKPEFKGIPAMVDQVINNSEMLIEEIEDAEEIRAEVKEEEMLETLPDEETNNFVEGENLNTAEIINYEENANAEVIQNSNNVAANKKIQNSFEECFIKETNIDKIRSEGVCVLKEKNMKEHSKPVAKRKSYLQDFSRLKRKRKKVTTVKVIAVKNRIAELYERIQFEQQKSQQLFSSEFLNNEQETQDAIESLINEKEEQQNTAETKPEITRKIIGETLITLIPEGTQIPSKLPSPVNKTLVNRKLLKDDLKTSSSNSIIYDFPKKEETTKEKLAVCPACGKTFRSHFSLTIHKRIHYLESDSSVKLAHKCSDCDQLFNKLSQLKHHVETVHYPEGFICKICNRQLSSLSLLERHMVKVHLDRPFNCKHCNKNFSDPLTYEEHLASHNSGEVFKCTTCGRKYATEFFLMEHMRNHKEQVPQTCVVCGKVTLRITQHMKIHTPRPKRLLSCSVCGKVFNFSSGLSHHFKIMHKLPRPPPKPKKESPNNTIKRKRRLKPNERTINRKRSALNSSTETEFMLQNDKYSDQIIEEQIEIPHEVYEDTTNSATLLPEPTQQKNHLVDDVAMNLPGSCHTHHQVVEGHHPQDVIIHKEEEAKRVIVELIQNSSYTSFFPDNLSSVLEVTPPIAREETIAAVNSIVHDC
ncbi:uncharacterized protein ACRADG_008317 [Cochliomyia hominivorax]